MKNKLRLLIVFVVICIIIMQALNSCYESDTIEDITELTSFTESDSDITEPQTTVELKKYKQEDTFSDDTVFVEYALTFAIENRVLWLSSPQGDVPEHDGLPNYTYSVYGMGYNLRHEAERLANREIEYFAVIISVNTSSWNSDSVKDYPANRTEKYEGKSIPEWFAYLDTLAGTDDYSEARRKVLGFVLDREKKEIESAGLEFCCLISSLDNSIAYFAIATEVQIAQLMNIGTSKAPSDAPYLLTIANKITIMNGYYQTNAQVKEAIDRYSKLN